MSRALPSRPFRPETSRGRGTRKAQRPRFRRLSFETLEDRTVPSILFGDTPGLTTSDNGGPMLSNAQVRVVFWGFGWNTSSGQTLETQMLNAMNSLNTSTRFYSPLPGADLSQYRVGTAARPTVVAHYTDTYNSPGLTFTDNDVFTMLSHEFGMTHQYYYYVIPDANSTPTGCGCSALHTYWWQGSNTDANREYYGWSRNLATPSLDDLTYLYSHEMTESITDPAGDALQVNPRNSSAWNEICDGEAQNYSYRLNGVLAQSFWSQADGKFTVPTGQRQNFLVSSSRVLTVNGDQLGANFNDTITLDVSGNGGVFVNLNGETAQFEPGAISSVVVNTGGGTDTVNVLRTVVPVSINYNGGAGTDVANLGTGGSVQGINAPVSIFNGPSFTHVNLDDSADTGNRGVTIGSGGVTGLAPAAINFSAFSVNTLSVRGGSGSNTYTVSATPAVTSVTLDTGAGNDTTNVLATSVPLAVNTTTSPGGSGNDVVNLGNAGSVQGLTGAVTILNNPSRDHVNIDDSADGGNRAVTIGSGGVTGLAPAALNFSAFSVTTLSVRGGTGNNAYTVAATPAVTSVTLDTGAGSDTTTVQATSVPLAVNTTTGTGGGGNDVVNLGNAGSVQGIFGAVTILNNPSRDHVALDDSADGGNHGVTIGSGGITGLAPAAIDFTAFSVSTLSVRGGSGNNTYTIAATPAATSMTLDTGAGNDTTIVQTTSVPLAVNTTTSPGGSGNDVVSLGSAGSVQGIFGAVTILNNPSRDHVNLDDSADGTGRAVAISSGGVTGLAPAAINFTSFSVSTLSVLGGTGNDTFTLSGSPALSVTLNGGGGTNTLVGPNANTTWNVTGANAGNLTGGFAFSNFQNLTGGSANDVFSFSNGASVAGTVNGGGGTDTLNLGAFTSNLTVNVTGANAGNVPGVVGAFVAVQNVLTGSGNDTFTFSDGASLAGFVNGGGGSNTLNEAAYSTPVTVNLAAGTATGTGGILNLQSFIGGSAGNTLLGPNAATTWSVTAQNAGTLSGGFSFSAFQNLTGGSGNDAFVLSDGVGIDGNLNGGGGTNLLDYLAYSTSVAVDLTAGTATGVGGSVANIQQLRGGQSDDTLNGNSSGTTTFLASPGNDTITGAGGTNTLVGPNADSTWAVSAQNAGTLTWATGTTTFSGIQNLTGGSGADSFALSDGVGVDGTIDGGGGSNTLDESAYSTPVTVNLATNTATGVGGNVLNVQTFLGGGASNTLHGPNAPTTWSITAQNAGTLTGGINFTTFQNLIGGSAADAFVFSDGVGVDGTINGGGGTNTLNYSAYSTPVTIDLTANAAPGVGGGFSNIQNFIGSAGGGNTLLGPNAPTTWNITAQNAGTLTGGFSFSAFQNLTGGSLADNFVLANGAGVDGVIDGGGGANALTESAYTTPVTVDLTADAATGVGGTFANLQSFVGGSAAGNTLNGPAADTTWNLAGSNAGTLTGGFAFTAFGNLTGGAGNNTFVIGAGASLSGTLTGGGATNSLDYSAYTGSVIVDLQTNFATAVAGGLSGTFVNVHGANSGGAGLYNLLIGAGGNVLTGGTGRRNILVAGATASTLNAGTGEDLLIGGTTSYDTEAGLVSWQQIAAYWAGTDPFNTRVNNLENGIGVPLLDGTIVTGNGGGNTMNGQGALALIYTDGADTISGFDPSSPTYPITP